MTIIGIITEHSLDVIILNDLQDFTLVWVNGEDYFASSWMGPGNNAPPHSNSISLKEI